MLTAGVPLAAGFSPPYSITVQRSLGLLHWGGGAEARDRLRAVSMVMQEAEQRIAFELFSPEVFQLILSLLNVWFLAQ